jgi:hypothetical protein
MPFPFPVSFFSLSPGGGEEWSPLLLPGLAVWYKSDVGVVEGSGGVSQISDQSGNGRHLVQVTDSFRPDLAADQLNGLPAIVFDGSDDGFPEVSWSQSQPWTFFGLIKCDVADEGVNRRLISTAPSLGPGGFLYRGGVLWRTRLGIEVNIPGLNSNTNWLSMVYIVNGASSSIRLSGSPTSVNPGTSAVTEIRFAYAGVGSAFWRFVEAGFVSGIVSGEDLSSLESYLSSRSGL